MVAAHYLFSISHKTEKVNIFLSIFFIFSLVYKNFV